jgi:hypothetical protein
VAKLQVVGGSVPQNGSARSEPLPRHIVETFDFQRIVASFDASRAANPKLGSWAVAPALSAAYLDGSDVEAIGGILAHEYGTRGRLDGVSASTAVNTLLATSFGITPQTFAENTGPEPAFPSTDHASRIGAPVPAGDGVRTLGCASAVSSGEWGSLWEDAIDRWLDPSWTLIPDEARDDDPQTAPASEREIAASWRRTRQLLEAHLQSHRGAELQEAEGVLAPSVLNTLGMPPSGGRDTLARVSGCALRALGGLEEGLKTLTA